MDERVRCKYKCILSFHYVLDVMVFEVLMFMDVPSWMPHDYLKHKMFVVLLSILLNSISSLMWGLIDGEWKQ